MRKIELIVIHCSASDIPWQCTPGAIEKLHTFPKTETMDWGEYKNVKCFGWPRVGYHGIIDNNAELFMVNDPGVVTWHCKGFNTNSLGYCLTGDKIISDNQKEKLIEVLKSDLKKYGLRAIDVLGHYELNKNKSCPNFNMDEIRRKLI